MLKVNETQNLDCIHEAAERNIFKKKKKSSIASGSEIIIHFST